MAHPVATALERSFLAAFIPEQPKLHLIFRAPRATMPAPPAKMSSGEKAALKKVRWLCESWRLLPPAWKGSLLLPVAER